MDSCAVCLFFDAATEAILRQMWDNLAEAGVSSEMPDVGWRPHITLAGCGHLQAQPYEAALRNFAAQAPCLPVVLSSIGYFLGEKSTLFLAVSVTQELLRFHRRHQSVLAPCATALSSYYLPGQWVPHCTLALNLTPKALASSISVCHSYRLPILGDLEAIGVVQVKRPQVHPLYAFPLNTKLVQR